MAAAPCCQHAGQKARAGTESLNSPPGSEWAHHQKVYYYGCFTYTGSSFVC